jgi:hypothetical protein
MAGSIRVARVNIQQQKMSFKKTGPSEDVKIVAGNTDERVVLAGEVTNGSDKTLELNKFIVVPTATMYSATAGTCAGAKQVMTTQPDNQTDCEAAAGTWANNACTNAKELISPQPTTRSACEAAAVP